MCMTNYNVSNKTLFFDKLIFSVKGSKRKGKTALGYEIQEKQLSWDYHDYGVRDIFFYQKYYNTPCLNC